MKQKQAFLSEQNQKIQSLFDDPDNLDDEIVETEEYDDKICQNIDYVHRFVQRKTRHSSQESSFAAGSTTISRKIQNINLPKLDLPSFSGNYLDWISFYDRFKGAVIDNERSVDKQFEITVPEVSSEGRSFEDVNFNHSHRRQLRCCNGNFAEPIRQQEIDTSSPHPWNCLISTSFTRKHTGITKTCRHNGGAQTFSSEHGTTS